MSRKFFDKYEYFWEYDYPFGEDFLKSIFGNKYQRKYSLNGEGIFNLIILDDKIYNLELKKASSMVVNDGKKAFRDITKDIIVDNICNKLKDNHIFYATNNGKIITFKYNDIIFKIEIIKKAAMPA